MLHPTSCLGRKTAPDEGSFPPTLVTSSVIYNVPSPYRLLPAERLYFLSRLYTFTSRRFIARPSVSPG